MNFKMLALLPLLALPFAAPANEAPAGTSQAQVAPKAVKAKKAVKVKKAKKVAAAKHEHWVCPMHDGGESDHAGQCPKCGMDLVKEEK